MPGIGTILKPAGAIPGRGLPGKGSMVVRDQVAVRPAISASWRRSRDAGVDAGMAAAPLVFDRDVLTDARRAHPLEPHLPVLEALLRGVTDETGQLMVVTDAQGRALWARGPTRVRRAAGVIGLAEGFCWAEDAVGTNGIGTALASGRPEQVYAAEHVARVLHRWSCAGAPIVDPDTGRPVGCIDVSAMAQALHPATVALVVTAARLVESRLENAMLARDERLRARLLPHLRGLGAGGMLVTATGRILAAAGGLRGRRVGAPEPGGPVRLPDGRTAVAEPLGEAFLLRVPGAGRGAVPGPRGAAPAEVQGPLLTLTFLGDGQPRALLDGRGLDLTLRHAEILALLALHPRGLSGDRLSLYLYGDEGSSATVRPEIHRLRQQFGDVVRARPYRLGCAVDADFLTLRRMLDEGDVAGAVRLYRGELLPRSEAPAVRAERDELAVRVRRQVLDRGGADALWSYAQTEPGRGDLEALERLRAVLPAGDPRLGAVASRSDRLLSGDL